MGKDFRGIQLNILEVVFIFEIVFELTKTPTLPPNKWTHSKGGRPTMSPNEWADIIGEGATHPQCCATSGCTHLKFAVQLFNERKLVLEPLISVKVKDKVKVTMKKFRNSSLLHELLDDF